MPWRNGRRVYGLLGVDREPRDHPRKTSRPPLLPPPVSTDLYSRLGSPSLHIIAVPLNRVQYERRDLSRDASTLYPRLHRPMSIPDLTFSLSTSTSSPFRFAVSNLFVMPIPLVSNHKIRCRYTASTSCSYLYMQAVYSMRQNVYPIRCAKNDDTTDTDKLIRIGQSASVQMWHKSGYHRSDLPKPDAMHT